MEDIAQTLKSMRQLGRLSQRDLATRAGTTQSVVARIENGQASPTMDTVERLAAAAGFQIALELVPQAPADPIVDAFKRDIDRTLLKQNLTKSPEERLRALESLQNLAREAHRAGARTRKQH
jgi:transcriptional regulator with XRE-family HTH domain